MDVVNAIVVEVERDEIRNSIAWDRIVVGFIVFGLRLGLTNSCVELMFCFDILVWEVLVVMSSMIFYVVRELGRRYGDIS